MPSTLRSIRLGMKLAFGRSMARVVVVVLAVFGERVLGQDQIGRYDILKGHDGQSSCEMKDSVHAACSTSPAPPLDATPTPTVCTCNNVFFNLWSACSFASGNNTLPVFTSWLSTCTNSSIDLTKSDAMTHQLAGLMGVDIPSWAMIAVPGNTSFDLQRAVVLQSPQNSSWSILQISLPIVTLLSGIMFTLLFVKMAQRKSNLPHLSVNLGMGTFSLPNMFHRRRRVKRVPQSDNWVIDGEGGAGGRVGRGQVAGGNAAGMYTALGQAHVHASGHAQPRVQTPVPGNVNASGVGSNMVRPPSPPETPNRDRERQREMERQRERERERESTIPGHPSVYSDQTPRASVMPDQTTNTIRGQVYPSGPHAQVRNQQPHLYGTSGPGLGPTQPQRPLGALPPGSSSDPFSYSGTSTPHTKGSINIRLPNINPFRRKPVVVVPVEPSAGFRIDGSSEGSVSARESTVVSGPGTDVGRNSNFDFAAIQEEDDGDGRESQIGPESEDNYYDADEDEGTNLMTDDQRRDSALDRATTITSGTRSTHGTSINSRVRIVSPTASTISPRSTMAQQPPPSPSQNNLRQIPLPPVPQVPPPLPQLARSSVRTGGPIPGAVPSSSRITMMSPILENQLSAGPGRSGFSSIYPSSPSASVLSASSEARPMPTRSASGDSMNSMEHPRPLPSPGMNSAADGTSSHQRKMSSESLRSRGPLPEPPGPTVLGNRVMTTSPPPVLSRSRSPGLPGYGQQQQQPNQQQHVRSGSNQSQTRFEELFDPYAPAQRSLSLDDESGSFYMPEAVERSGTPSSRTDPAVYFPGPVRGAGYGGL